MVYQRLSDVVLIALVNLLSNCAHFFLFEFMRLTLYCVLQFNQASFQCGLTARCQRDQGIDLPCTILVPFQVGKDAKLGEVNAQGQILVVEACKRTLRQFFDELTKCCELLLTGGVPKCKASYKYLNAFCHILIQVCQAFIHFIQVKADIWKRNIVLLVCRPIQPSLVRTAELPLFFGVQRNLSANAFGHLVIERIEKCCIVNQTISKAHFFNPPTVVYSFQFLCLLKQILTCIKYDSFACQCSNHCLDWGARRIARKHFCKSKQQFEIFK